MREAAIEHYLVRKARSAGWTAWKFVSPGIAGVPDRVLLGPGGQTVFVEVKAPHGHLSPLQRARIKELAGLSHRVHVVYSYDDVDALVGALS